MRLASILVILAALAGPATAQDASRNQSLVEPGPFPHRVHVFEDFETEIERRWWMRGTPIAADLPPSPSASVPNRRSMRAAETKDFDQRMGDLTRTYRAVIFNPVPGPPMAGNTRLSFRYWLKGTDTLRVQIYSLTNNYHRRLVLTGLPQEKWQSATVDMTAARRPDQSGGPLAADERIDDIQFYIEPDAELRIDDIVLYEPGKSGEKRPFPRRILFTGWFDTGEQGKEWPGDFEIVLHEKPRTWDAARSVDHPQSKLPWIRVNLRGERTLSATTNLFFRYRFDSESPQMRVVLANSKTGEEFPRAVTNPTHGEWTEVDLTFQISPAPDGKRNSIDEIRFLLNKPGNLHIDDLLLYEPGADKP